LLGRVGVLGLASLSARAPRRGVPPPARCSAVTLRLRRRGHLPRDGVALGCVYPLMMALVGERIPEARGTAAGLAAGAGALGGSAVPWLTGTFGDAFGVSAAVASLAAWCAVIALAAGVARGIR
jgi:MFS family permease